MNTVDNSSFQAVAEHSRAAHKRDVAFGVILAVVLLFALGAVRFSSERVANTPAAKQCIVGTNC
ncbi:MAG: hypothetical protein F9K40_19200 [Kofleriaceae bacterium]|nr:MAG: hypothetical protein F9K40_19200 [Kofleriaceae bacterium]